MPPRLPPELQRMVIEELRLPRLPVGTPRSLNPEFIEGRSALLSLCLTSRHFQELAEPLLYESIALTRTEQFVLLFNSLLANRDRRSWIRSIACPMCIMEETDFHAALPLWNRLIAPRKGMGLDRREKQALEQANLGLDHISEDDRWFNNQRLGDWAFGDNLIALILWLTTRLEDILVQIPTDEQETREFYSLESTLRSGTLSRLTGVLQSLRSVRLQPTRTIERPDSVRIRRIEPHDVEPGSDAGFGIDPLRLQTFELENVRSDAGFGIDPLRLQTFELENVEEVEFCGDNGIWFKLLKADRGPWTAENLPRDLKRFRSLKSLKLHESRTTPSYLRYLLDEAHSLETFQYTTRQQEWRQTYWAPRYLEYAFMPSDFFSINEALWPIRNTVKELALGSVQRPWADGDEEYRHVELIVVLDAFEKLTHLSIDIRWLIPIMLDLEEEVAIVPLCVRLPRSIEEIKLTETWTKSDLRAMFRNPGLEVQAMAWVRTALWTLLGDDSKGGGEGMKLAQLRKVTLTAVPAFHTYGALRQDPAEEERGDDCQSVPLKTDDCIEQMKSVFARRGVEFTVNWMSYHSSFSQLNEESDSD